MPTLNRLQGLVGHLAVISGRDRATLASRLPPSWLAIGSYGLELPESASASGYPDGFNPASARGELAAAGRELETLAEQWPPVRLETKTWGRAVHFRGGGEAIYADPATFAAVAAVAARHGLHATRGRLVIEIRPEGADKGRAISHLARRLGPSAIVFAGDDIGDVSAWEELRRLSATTPTLGVALASSEIGRDALASCDLVLEGRQALPDFLGELLELAET